MDKNQIRVRHKDQTMLIPVDENGLVNIKMVRRYFPGVSGLTFYVGGEKAATPFVDDDHVKVNITVECFDYILYQKVYFFILKMYICDVIFYLYYMHYFR